jgi:hypothetical protein
LWVTALEKYFSSAAEKSGFCGSWFPAAPRKKKTMKISLHLSQPPRIL